ncbi:hypothetical protein ACFX1X_031019 [Malus domestica]
MTQITEYVRNTQGNPENRNKSTNLSVEVSFAGNLTPTVGAVCGKSKQNQTTNMTGSSQEVPNPSEDAGTRSVHARSQSQNSEPSLAMGQFRG